MTEASAAAESPPEFSDLIKYVQERRPVLFNWIVQNESALRLAYDYARSRAEEDGKTAADFAPERMVAALGLIRHRGRKRGNLAFKRPCCKKYPLSWPFCDPNC